MINNTIQTIHSMMDGIIHYNQIEPSAQIHGVCMDSRQYTKSNLFIAMEGETIDSHQFIEQLEAKGCPLFILTNADYAPRNAAYIIVEDAIVALQQLAKNYRASLPTTIIGITGSNGKTSCKDLLAAALSSTYKTQKTQGNKNNEIGVPLTLLSLAWDCEIAVVEMGMEKPGDIEFLNDIVQQNHGILTNVGDAHLLYMKTKENIAKEKLHIIDPLQSTSLFTYCGDDACISSVLQPNMNHLNMSILTYGQQQSNDLYLTSLNQTKDGISFQTNQSAFTFTIEILGKHQAINALGVIALCYHLGLNDSQIQAGFKNLEATSMRNELMNIRQCSILNDSYKSNPQSALAALETFALFISPYKIAVMADMLELGERTQSIHEQFGKNMAAYDVDEILCYGSLSEYVVKGYKKGSGKANIQIFTSHNEIATYLKGYLHKECMILFKGSRGMALDVVIEQLKEF